MAEDTQAVPSIDMAAINAEIEKLSPSELVTQLTAVRVRQKVQQKKQYAKGTMKVYQQRQIAKRRAMKEAALATPATEKGFANLWEQINANADAQAEREFEASVETPAEE